MTYSRYRISAPIVVCLSAGLVVGLIAKLLGEAGNQALGSLGTGMAIWLGIGFIMVSELTRKWQVANGLWWTCALVATYLYAWLLAYHLTYLLLDSAPGWTVWGESRLWVAAVAPSCVVLGILATCSLKTGHLAEVCLAIPIAWSLPEVVSAVHHGWSYALIVGAPTLAVAVVPLFRARLRVRHPVTIVATAMLGGALLVLFLSDITRYLDGR